MTAADRLRQAIEAMPRRARLAPWTSDDDKLFASPDTERRQRNKAWVGEVDGPELAAYIALMDPTVGAALADLLEALARDHSSETEHARIALEQAIERGQA